MPTPSSTNVAVIGLGLMGTRMGKALAAHPAFEIAQAFDKDPALTQSWAQQFRTHPAESTGAAIADPSIHLLYLATPPATHTALADQAFDAGKAVFLEKPLDSDLERAESWTRSAAEKRAWMHFPFATLPGMGAMRQALQSKSIGTPLRVEIELQFSAWPRTWHTAGPWLAGPDEGGFCREVFSHFAYLTQTLLGPMQLQSRDIQYSAAGTESRVAARFDANGVSVQLCGGVAAGAPDYNRWTLFGTQQSFRITNWGQAEQSDGTAWTPLDPGPAESQGLEATLDQLKRALDGKPHTLSSPMDGLQAMRAVESLLR